MLHKLVTAGASNALALTLTLATSVLLGRLLEPSARGVIGKMMLLILMGTIIGGLSIPSFAIRQSKIYALSIESVVLSVKNAAFCAAAATAVVLASIVLLAAEDDIASWAALVMVVVVTTEAIKGLCIAIATRRSKLILINSARVLAPLSYAVTIIFICGFFHLTTVNVLLAFAVSQVISLLPLLGMLRHSSRWEAVGKSLWGCASLLSNHLGYSLGFLAAQSERIVLAMFFSNADMGRYLVAYTVCSAPNLLLQPLINQIIGSRTDAEGSSSSKHFAALISVFVVVPVAFLLFYSVYGALVLELIFGAQYSEGMGDIVTILSAYVVLLTLKQLLVALLMFGGDNSPLIIRVEVLQLLLYCLLLLTVGFSSMKILIAINISSVFLSIIIVSILVYKRRAAALK